MTWFRSRRGLLALLGFLLLVLFVVRPGVNRMRTRIARSVGSALGRQVEISSASLRLLPQPGFDLENFVVYDDPAFGAEPILRSDDVTASLRITSLLRGRLEISQLSLSEPSINLVRNNSGHWNLEYLLERAAKTPVAPTGRSRREARPEFPYIEADRARINFKFGLEKTRFALMDADVALFQDSENIWGMRLEARPVRTDANLSDTGLLKITGSWQRAQSLRDTPLRFNLHWEQAQLGQASKLIYGVEKGWRGTAVISAEMKGTPADITILGDGSVSDFKRYDTFGEKALRLRVQCGGHYSSTTQNLSEIICQSPVGDGALSLRGNVAVSRSAPAYHLTVSAQDVPMQAVLDFMRHSKKAIPDNLVAAGTLDGTIKVQRDQNTGAVWQGGGETSEFRLRSQDPKSDISLNKVHFEISPASDGSITDRLAGHSGKDFEKHGRTNQISEPVETRVEITPFPVELGGQNPATVQGWFSKSGYNFSIAGNAPLQSLLRAGTAIGIPSPAVVAEGKTRFDLQIADAWSGVKAPKVTGKAELTAVHAQIRGLNSPLVIESAEMLLNQDQVNVQNLTALVADATWHGSLMLPRPCATEPGCLIQFDLHADEIATDRLNKLMNPQFSDKPWYRFFSASRIGNPFLRALRGTGHLSADRVRIQKLVVTQVSADAEVNKGKVQLSNLRGIIFGGLHQGQGKADFTVRPPEYSASGTLEHFALLQLATAMQDNWISGTGSATYHATATGSDAASLLASATAIVQVEASNGTLPHIELTDAPAPLQLRHFEGGLAFRHGEFSFDNAELETANSTYQVTGTVSLQRTLKLKLERKGSRGFNIAGTLRTPIISSIAAPETQAALKP